MKKPDAVLFDLDGTLWNSTEGIYDALMNLEEDFPQGTPPITKEILDSCMGLPMDEISKRLFPTAPEDVRTEIMDRFIQSELKHLKKVGGTLYRGVETMLQELSAVYPLFIVSNCQLGYIDVFLEYFGFARYFTDFLSWGDTQLPKGETLRLIKKRHGMKYPVYIGDTRGDEIAARHANMKFIFVDHGFGTAHSPDLTLNDFSELKELLKELSWD